MLEAKDTVMNINQWLDIIGCDRSYKKDMKPTYERMKIELEKQAEITWRAREPEIEALATEIDNLREDVEKAKQAGMKEVVEWIKNQWSETKSGYLAYVITPEEWQAKLEEWGIMSERKIIGICGQRTKSFLSLKRLYQHILKRLAIVCKRS